MDYGSIPPEINSARMYAGPGSGPMLAAAASWNLLASELRSAATSFEWLVASLSSQGWWGPSASAMAAAAEPYFVWLSVTAEQAEQAAAQAYAAAEAYATAHAMTVPPAAIETNRVLLASLVKTNALGQNTAAIAAAEARYGQMWAQDAVAMYGYAAASATATQLIPFADAPETTNADDQGGQAAGGVGPTDAHAQLPNALRSMASPAEGTSPLSPDWDWTKFFDGLFGDTWGSDDGSGLNINAQLWNTIAATGIFDPGGNIEGFSGLATLGFLARGMDGGTAALSRGGLGPASGMALASATPGGLEAAGRAAGGASSPVAAGVGQATLVGSLSAPPSWAAATPTGAPTAGTGSGWTVAPESRSMTAMPPPIPPGGAGRHGGYGLGTPRYGVKLTVMPRPIVVG
ncbi:PPE family protein [Mycolicibacter heraklionensis]|uniref:PPE family protein n=1 Tax=Mycolicibacter heraklionensis TaxID=512402 RepID=A0A9X7WHV9_9MYCO|nr:PPE family protein [Mycolicibacter heraklionensis]QZA07749.1 PPE family protein [Mycolicibacter heraklionensis]